MPAFWKWLPDIFPLRSMPNRVDGNALLLHAIQHDVRCASDDELADTWLRASPAQARMISEDFDDSGDPRRQAFRGLRFVLCDISPNLPEPRSGQGRPDNLYRHKASSLWTLPQTQRGGGNS